MKLISQRCIRCMEVLKAQLCCGNQQSAITKHISVLSYGTKAKLTTENLDEHRRYILKSEKGRGRVSYIVDQKLADDVAEIITAKLKPDSTVLECNPGVGLLTDHLLTSDVSKVIAAEPKEDFLPYLKKLQKVHGNLKLEIEQVNVLRCSDERLQGMLGKLKDRPWESDPPLSVFGVVPHHRREVFFLRSVLLKMVTRAGFYSIGRTEFFLFISSVGYKLMNMEFPTRDVRFHHQFSIMFQLFFDFDCLLQVDKRRFTPPIRRKARESLLCMKASLDPTTMYLVHLKPKKDIYKTICSPDELPKFAAFLKQVTWKKKQRVIPKMESLVPGSGIHLILMNYTMLSKFTRLVPKDYVQLYQEMIKWPEYQESSLQMLLEKDTEDDLAEGSDFPEHVEAETAPADESFEDKLL